MKQNFRPVRLPTPGPQNRLSVLALLLAAGAVAGCQRPPLATPGPAGGAALPSTAAPGVSSPIRFREVTAEAGLHAVTLPEDPARITIVQISSGGGAFLDYDGDGKLDLLIIGRERPTLYHNDGNGHFTDVTAQAGLDVAGTWMGCATGDYDNDGRTDLVLTGYHCLRLFHNEGGRFVDRTAESGLVADRWYTSAGFADVNNDGKLDLYVGAYVDFGPDKPQYCPAGIDPTGKQVMAPCGPEPYAAMRGRLYLNEGKGHFRDVTRQAGLESATGKTLGVAFGDYDGDGKADLYLANDRVAGDLFHNETLRGGLPRFRSVGVTSGTAFSQEGNVQGGMGVAWGDANNDGRQDLAVGTYQNEAKCLYLNEGNGLFREASTLSGLAPARPYVAFGTGFFDADNDGWLDLFLANGHVLGPVERIDPRLSYPQPLQVFHNRGGGSYEDVSAGAGAIFGQRLVGRAVAFGDYDNDGRCDVLVVDVQGRPYLLHNESQTGNHWLRVRLEGSASNRDGIGARVTVRAGARDRMREATTGGSYLAAHDPRLLFGLGAATSVDSVSVRWPSGKSTRISAQPADREIVVREESRR